MSIDLCVIIVLYRHKHSWLLPKAILIYSVQWISVLLRSQGSVLSQKAFCSQSKQWMLARPKGCNTSIIVMPFLSPLIGLGMGFLGAQHNEPACNREGRVRAWSGEDPGETWQPILVLLRGKSQGQRKCWATVHCIAKSQTQLKRLCMPHTV